MVGPRCARNCLLEIEAVQQEGCSLRAYGLNGRTEQLLQYTPISAVAVVPVEGPHTL